VGLFNGTIGSSFDDFLKEEEIYESVTARAIERVRARQRDQSAPHGERPVSPPDPSKDKA
jgi:hypothetical protein